MGDYGPLELSHDIAAFVLFRIIDPWTFHRVPCGAVTLRVLSVVKNGRLPFAGTTSFGHFSMFHYSASQ